MNRFPVPRSQRFDDPERPVEQPCPQFLCSFSRSLGGLPIVFCRSAKPLRQPPAGLRSGGAPVRRAAARARVTCVSFRRRFGELPLLRDPVSACLRSCSPLARTSSATCRSSSARSRPSSLFGGTGSPFEASRITRPQNDVQAQTLPSRRAAMTSLRSELIDRTRRACGCAATGAVLTVVPTARKEARTRWHTLPAFHAPTH